MEQRIATLRDGLHGVGCEAYVSFVPPENEYLTGFRGTTSATILTQDEALFFCDFRYTEQAQKQVKGFAIQEMDGTLEEKVGTWLQDHGIESAGFDSTATTVHQQHMVQSAFTGILMPLPDLVRGMRMVKSPKEIEKLRQASALAESVLASMLPEIKEGIREEALAARFAYELRMGGAQGESFDMIALFGARSSLPHGMPSARRLQKSDIVLLDFGCVLNSYCSDLTRTYAYGTLPGAWFEEIYEVTLRAQYASLDAIRPGVVCHKVDAVARDIITEAGYGTYFGHGLGHGVGIEVHEAPRLNKRSSVTLEPGMVVTVEPGIYLPEQGGVRIEDLVVVTETGCERLTTSPKALRILE